MSECVRRAEPDREAAEEDEGEKRRKRVVRTGSSVSVSKISPAPDGKLNSLERSNKQLKTVRSRVRRFLASEAFSNSRPVQAFQSKPTQCRPDSPPTDDRCPLRPNPQA